MSVIPEQQNVTPMPPVKPPRWDDFIERTKPEGDLISRKVLLDLIKGWENLDKYYRTQGGRAKYIPISEIKLIVEDCPAAGEDEKYFERKRYHNAYIEGKQKAIRRLKALIKELEEEES